MKLGLAFAGAVVALLLPFAATAGGVVKLSSSNNGKLKIQGDKKPNAIAIQMLANGDVRVLAQTDRFGNDTGLKVGNQKPTAADFAGIKSIDVKLKNGDDRLVFDGETEEIVILSGPLKIDMGQDDDWLELNSTQASSLSVKTSKGADQIRLQVVEVEGKAKINAGGDDDWLVVDELSAGDLDVKMDNGDDTVCLDDLSFVPGKRKVDGGNGPAWWDRIDDDLGVAEKNFEAQEDNLCII